MSFSQRPYWEWDNFKVRLVTINNDYASGAERHIKRQQLSKLLEISEKLCILKYIKQNANKSQLIFKIHVKGTLVEKFRELF